MKRIFVAIASYRDPECQWTLKDLFESATHPQRISVGICWQFDLDSDQSCFTLPNPRSEQTRVINVGLNETRGACWAKSQALSLRNGEEYVLLIDSHMRFAPGWDVEMIDMLTGIDNPRAFLSTYPAGYEPPNQRRFSTPRLAPVKFFERVMSQNSVLLEMSRPMESSLVAGGYLFGPAEMFDQVPYDPHIYFIGEEITHAARYYTHGWDGYTPHKCLIHHYYSRKEATKHWQDEKETWSRLNRISYQRVRHILQIERAADPEVLAEIKRYDLGSERTLASFQAAIGVNFNALLIDRTRHESVSGIEAALATPSPPLARHEMASLCVLACRPGQLLFPKRDAYIGKSLQTYGEWTEGITRLCGQLFSPGQTVMEVGAGWGTRTVGLARLLGAGGRVIAIEQSRRHADLLHANCVLNALDNVRIVQARAQALPGAAEVIEPDFDNEGNFGAVLARKAAGQEKPYVDEFVIDDRIWGRIDGLVVDAPGNAHEILMGARALIAASRPPILANADNVVDAEKTRKFLLGAGYRLWSYSCPFFSTENYFRQQENVFGNLASQCIVAVADDRDLAIGSAELVRLALME